MATEAGDEAVFSPARINRESPEISADESWAQTQLDERDLEELDVNNETLGEALKSNDGLRSIPSEVLPQNDYSIGAAPWAAMESFDLWDGGTAEVNLDSGNLLLSVTDWEANAPGIAPRLTRYYNSLSDRQSDYLGNWTLGVGADVGLAGTQSTYESSSNTFYAPSGYTANFFFDREAYGGWENQMVTPEGLNVTAGANISSFVDEIEWNRSGNRMFFDGPQQGQEGWLNREEDRNGIGTSYGYTSQGESFTMTDAAGRTSSFSSGATSSVFETFDERQWHYSLNGAKLTNVEGPQDFIQGYEYDADGRLSLARVTMPSGEGPQPAIAVDYDAEGRVASLAQGSWTVDGEFEELTRSTFSYTDGQTSVTDARGNTSTYELDERGRQTAATDANGNRRSQEWTANNDIASSTDALSGGSDGGENTATYEYDDLNNATGYTLPTGAAASASYAQGTDCPNAGTGNPHLAKCATDTSGNTTEYEYDEAGNRTKESKDGGAVAKEYTYDNADRSVCGGFAGQICSATDGNGNTTTYSYNTNGDLLEVAPPAPQGNTTYEYDDASRMTAVTDPNGDTTTYTYDAYDRIVTTTYADGSTTKAFHGAQGALLSQHFEADDVEQRVDYDYDGLMGETSKTVRGASATTYAQSYDAAGNVTTMTGPSGTTTASYDAANQLIALTEPGGTCGEGSPAAGSKCVKFQYDGNGEETLRTFPGGATQSTERDAASRPTRIVATDKDGTARVDIAYSYSRDGEDDGAIQTRTSTLEEGINPGAVTTYEHDALSRVISAVETAGGTTTASWSYAYDAAGNRTEQVTSGDTGSAAGTTTYGYDAAHRLVSTSQDTTEWLYDAAGNLTQHGITGETSSYGERGQVTAIGDTDYTSVNRGNTETVADSSGDSFYASTLGLMTREGTSGSTSYLNDNEGQPVGFAAQASHYYAMDHLGSVVGLFGADGTWEGGYSYSPYGEQRAIADTTPAQANQLRYIAGEMEKDGTYRFGARYYDPSIGRFTQMDPSGQEANPYAYATCDPINAKDPSGLLTAACQEALLFAGMGLISTIISIYLFPSGVAQVTIAKATLATIGIILGTTATVHGVGKALAGCF